MKKPTLMQQTFVKVAEVQVRDRLRPVSEAGVESLVASITETGVMKDAIHVRRKKDGSFVLIAGGHRLEGARRLGWEEIEAKVWTDVTDDWARLMEIDDNLAGAEMNALDTAVFLAERKAVYERMHPETKAAAFKGNRHTGSLAADTMSVASFARASAEKFGLTDRHVRRMIAAGAALSRDEVRWLRAAKAPVKLADLQALSKIGDQHERSQVCIKLSNGHAPSVSAALRALRVERGVEDPVKSPADQQLLALLSAWSRAGKAVRRRFVEAEFGDLSPLFLDVAERRDAAEIAEIRRGIAAE